MGVLDCSASGYIMHVMDSITYSQTRRNLGAAMDKANEGGEPLAIRRRQGENVVLVPEARWNEVARVLQTDDRNCPRNAASGAPAGG